jgi:SAM-dependent methyltransferase
LKRRAAKAGLLERVDLRLAREDSMGLADLTGKVDFAVAIAMVHEIPDPGRFFAETAATLKPGARLLLVEPAGHVDDAAFQAELDLAAQAGLSLTARPTVGRSHAALLQKD